jgi:hypothetical protein
MSRHALDSWLTEASGDVAAPQSPMGQPDSPVGAGGPPSGDPNVANPPSDMATPSPGTQQNSPNAASKSDGQDQSSMPDVANDPQAPDMPQQQGKQDFENWKNEFFKASVRGDVNKMIESIQQIRDTNLEAYPRKFVEDNLQILFLRQNANIDKASKTIRNNIKQNLDQNNPSVSMVNHMFSVLQTMPELNNTLIKLKGLLGMKGDMHRKYMASLLGAIQVGSGGNNEDLIYNERDYSIRISTRFNDKWGKVDIGKWSMREDDPERFLSDSEQKRLDEGSPEEKEVLRHRIVIEAISDTFKKRSFLINVVTQDGTINTLGWDLGGSIRNAYTSGKLIVKLMQGENTEAMIDTDGAIVPYVDVKIIYVKDAAGGVDDEGKPSKEEHEFMERIDGILFLTAQYNILKEAASSFGGIVLKETPYSGNPSDLQVLMRCVPSAPEILLRNC